MVVRTDTERTRHSRRLVLELLGSSVDLSLTADVARWNEEYGAEPTGSVRRRHPTPGATTATTGHRAPPRPTGRRGDRRPAGEGRQPAVRARLRQVHPLLPVRRRLRRAVAADVGDRRRRARLRRPHLDRVRRRPARLGVRVLRQLHPGVPDRGADVHVRARDARRRHVGRGAPDADRHDLPVLRRGVHADAARPGRRDRQGHARRPTTRSPTATSASRAASASSTCRTAPAERARPATRRAPHRWGVSASPMVGYPCLVAPAEREFP